MSQAKPLDLDNIPAPLADAEGKIDRIDLYRIDVTHERHFSFGTWHGRQQMVLRYWSQGKYGWGETIASANEPDLKIASRKEPYEQLLGKTVDEAIRFLRTHQEDWKGRQSEIAEMALLDLGGRLLETPTLELLELPGREPIPGLFCVLEKDIDAVKREVQNSLDQNLTTHLKIKLFGDVELDEKVIRAAREVFGREGTLTGDVNGGYFSRRNRQPGQKPGLEDVAARLTRLHAAGLDACEDPGHFEDEDWIRLQKLVEPLSLLPDAPTRPATVRKNTLPDGMGHIYNIHPDCMHSFLDAVALARRIQDFGGPKLMVGDQSLIGPACDSWTQLAIGLGADWVEAILKPHECRDFIDCIRSRNVRQQEDGRFGLSELSPGFGLEVDEDALAQKAGDVWTLQ